jgi:hypothetical protein
MEKAVVLTIQTSSSRLQVGVVCPLYFHDTEHFIKVASRRGMSSLLLMMCHFAYFFVQVHGFLCLLISLAVAELVLQPVMEFGSTPVP